MIIKEIKQLLIPTRHCEHVSVRRNSSNLITLELFVLILVLVLEGFQYHGRMVYSTVYKLLLDFYLE